MSFHIVKVWFLRTNFNKIMYNSNNNTSKSSEFKSTSAYGSPLLFNSKVLVRSYITPTINTIDKHEIYSMKIRPNINDRS